MHQFQFDRAMLAVVAEVRKDLVGYDRWNEMDELLNKSGYLYQLLRLTDSSHWGALLELESRLAEDGFTANEIRPVLTKLDECGEEWLEESILDSAIEGGWIDEIPDDFDDAKDLIDSLPEARRMQLIQAIQSLI